MKSSFATDWSCFPAYHILVICPRTDITMGACGFMIQLFPGWKPCVAKSELTQELINKLILNMHRAWLDGCGYTAIFDPDEDPLDKWEREKLGKTRRLSKSARPLYDEYSIRVGWGEWGPEHLTVPGNACGLDIDDSISSPLDGRLLVPHNVDSTRQVILLLTIFTTIADYLISNSLIKANS